MPKTTLQWIGACWGTIQIVLGVIICAWVLRYPLPLSVQPHQPHLGALVFSIGGASLGVGVGLFATGVPSLGRDASRLGLCAAMVTLIASAVMLQAIMTFVP